MSNYRTRYSDDEVIQFASYQLSNHLTIRQASNELHVAKSTLHNMMNTRLPELDYSLYIKMRELYQENLISGRHKGGVTVIKMLKESKQKENQKDVSCDVATDEEKELERSRNRKRFFGIFKKKITT